ncbi:MAG: hypothetical protein M3Y67_01075 [Pseudomonadota bacterium]|nr:hypothetical protein [Pseudomonadota bacterium]
MRHCSTRHAHGLVIGDFLQHHVRLPDRMAMPLRLGNTSLTIVAAEPPHRPALLDCTAHLDGIVEDDPKSLAGD